MKRDVRALFVAPQGACLDKPDQGRGSRRAAAGSVALALLLTASCMSVAEIQEEEHESLTSCGTCHEAEGNGIVHAVHVTAGRFSKGMECRECHHVDEDGLPERHFNGTVDVTFEESAVARSGGAKPFFDGNRCQNVYCHGVTLEGGEDVHPLWNMAEGHVQFHCGSCHGLPPREVHPPYAQCSGCHAAVIESGELNLEYHLNGVVDFNTSVVIP